MGRSIRPTTPGWPRAGCSYNRFHVTALCSPTRAALLTGRNSHHVGFGSVGEFAGGFPGYTATSAARLRAAAADPARQRVQHRGVRQVAPDSGRPAGPGRPVRPLAERLGLRLLLRLPRRRGQPVGPVPGREPEDHRHARGVLRRGQPLLPARRDGRQDDRVAARRARRRTPHKPFFAYFSTGCSHAPHHVSQRVGGQVQGQVRPGLGRPARGDVRPAEGARRHPRRRRADARATRRSRPGTTSRTTSRRSTPGRWRSTRASRRTPTTTWAGCIDAIEELGELDNTLVIWIWGDNGASMEGTITGSFNELTMQNGIPLTDEMQLQLAERYGGLDAWGAPIMDPHYSAAWAWAGNTPFQWGKQVGSHLGGTRNPMVVHWPDKVTDAGGLRSQFTPRHRHRADDPRAGRDPAARRRSTGSSRSPMHGTSFASTADRRGRAGAPHPAVLRDRRQPGHVQGRLVAGDEDRADPVGAHARRRSSPTRPASGTPTTTRSSSTTCPTTSARPTTWPRSTPRRWPSSRSCSGRRPSATRCCRCWPRSSSFFGIAAPDHRRDQVRVPRRRPERPVRDDPADLQPLLLDHRRPRHPRGRRRGRDRGRGRPPRWLLALRRGRQAHPHLLDDGRVHLPAGRRGGPPQRAR